MSHNVLLSNSSASRLFLLISLPKADITTMKIVLLLVNEDDVNDDDDGI